MAQAHEDLGLPLFPGLHGVLDGRQTAVVVVLIP